MDSIPDSKAAKSMKKKGVCDKLAFYR